MYASLEQRVEKQVEQSIRMGCMLLSYSRRRRWDAMWSPQSLLMADLWCQECHCVIIKKKKQSFAYLVASWVVDQLVAAGVKRLPCVHGIQDDFISNHHLFSRNTKHDKIIVSVSTRPFTSEQISLLLSSHWEYNVSRTLKLFIRCVWLTLTEQASLGKRESVTF